jgi:transposase
MLNPLLPEAVPLRCRCIRIQADLIAVEVETTGPTAACPICGQPSGRVHSRYTRTMGDLPWQGRVVRWSLVARKFFCDRAACPRQIFTERLPEVTAPYARKTGRLEQALTEVAFACGGEPGARLARQLGMPVSACGSRPSRAPSTTASASISPSRTSWISPSASAPASTTSIAAARLTPSAGSAATSASASG